MGVLRTRNCAVDESRGKTTHHNDLHIRTEASMSSVAARHRTTDGSAHRAAVRESVQSVTTYLCELLSGPLVGHITGVEVSTVNRWAAGSSKPKTPTEKRLRDTYQIARMLSGADNSDTIRAWFIGMNPSLNDETPSDVLREDRAREVLAAARAFMDGA